MKQPFLLKNVEEKEILKLLKDLDVKNSTGEDKLPPKLVKCAESYIYKPLTLIINQSFKPSTFPM